MSQKPPSDQSTKPIEKTKIFQQNASTESKADKAKESQPSVAKVSTSLTKDAVNKVPIDIRLSQDAKSTLKNDNNMNETNKGNIILPPSEKIIPPISQEVRIFVGIVKYIF